MSSETITRNDLENILNEVLPSTAVDYIVEQGTSGIWTYRKWNSGVAECWGLDSASFAMTTQIGSSGHYYAIRTVSISALGLLTIQNVQAIGQGGGYYFSTKVEDYTTSQIRLTAFSILSYTQNITHSIYIIGTWK